MNYVEYAFAHVPLLRKWASVLLAELARFAYTFNLLLFECRESDDDSFRFHCLEFVEIDVVDSLVTWLYVGVGFHALCEHV